MLLTTATKDIHKGHRTGKTDKNGWSNRALSRRETVSSQKNDLAESPNQRSDPAAICRHPQASGAYPVGRISMDSWWLLGIYGNLNQWIKLVDYGSPKKGNHQQTEGKTEGFAATAQIAATNCLTLSVSSTVWGHNHHKRQSLPSMHRGKMLLTSPGQWWWEVEALKSGF